jgi:hypothetical protein
MKNEEFRNKILNTKNNKLRRNLKYDRIGGIYSIDIDVLENIISAKLDETKVVEIQKNISR